MTTVERYVFIRLIKALAHERIPVIAEARRVLACIPSIASFEVGAPADAHAEAAWDICLRVRFASIDDVEPYRLHPAHRAFVDEFLKPRVEVIKAWNFLV